MGVSIIDTQREIIIETIKQITGGDWKILVLDEYSKKIVDNVVASEDDILSHNIVNIEMIEEKRDANPETDAIYLITPLDHIADCLIADLERRRYKDTILLWITAPGNIGQRVQSTRYRIAYTEILPLDFFPRESNLVTFRDKSSFLYLYHPQMNEKVQDHFKLIAKRVTAVCATLGECPRIRYWGAKGATHDAAVMCYHLARFIEGELLGYADRHPEKFPQTNRPPGLLVVTDRAMDIVSPLVHEFTYQAMAHDLLPIKDDEKVTFQITINEGSAEAEDKDMELQEKDKVWVENRHTRMTETIAKLTASFNKFVADNPDFNDQEEKTSLSAIRNMMANLPQYTELKDAYTLHLKMAEDCMAKFAQTKLGDIGAIEQALATGFDEDGRKPKNTLDTVVRILDDESVSKSDRLRLTLLWIIYRDGVILEDVKRLLAHAELPIEETELVTNLAHFGCKPKNGVKEQRPPRATAFPPNPQPVVDEGDFLFRYEPALATLIDHLCKGTIDNEAFPFTRPLRDPNEDPMIQAGAGASLRTAGAPSWARAGRTRAPDNRQRVIVFMAGGATYSEARACYEMGNKHGRDIYLATSHMLTPRDFIDGLRHLSWTGERLRPLVQKPRPKPPPVLQEDRRPPAGVGMGGPGRPGPGIGGPPPRPGGMPVQSGRPPPPQGGLPNRPVAPPTQQMGQMQLGNGGGSQSNASSSQRPLSGTNQDGPHKLEKEKKKKKWFK